MNIKSKEQSLVILFILILVSYGVYLCFIGGYGSDEDTLPMIYVFEARLADGRFVTSRFTSYPIPEIGIGFLSYFFGSFTANLFTYIFHLIGLILIFFSFNEKKDKQNFKIFLILCLSSPILFFENLEPMDYSWAFLFFSIGTFFYSKKIFELAILAFGFAIGCRINFLIFALIVIFFFNLKDEINIKRKITFCFCTFIIGGLFYLPIWFNNSFELNWITAARPTDQGILGLLARFSFKSWSAIGYLQFFLILYGIKTLNLKLSNQNKLLAILIISNLVLFFYIPAELSYLQPAIIFLYLIIVKEFKKKVILFLITLNFINWGINFQLLKIIHKDNSLCGPKQAVSASIDLNFKQGAIYDFYESRKMIKCWINVETERGKRILEGKSLRVKK